MTDHIQRERLRYRSRHRGMREMDILLGGFSDRYLDGFDKAQLTDFAALLELPDQDLYDWYLGRFVPPEEKMSPVLRLFLTCKITA
ncbi:MAG: succinate dehydrogenase assembly factor 2 [Alphaproteobacteria bacterium]